MKSSILTLFLGIGLLFAACNSEKKKMQKETSSEIKTKEAISLNEYMVGSWETTYLKIEYQTYNKADSMYVFEDDFSKPNSIKAQSKYNKDGTFTAWYKQPDGSKVGESTGTWKTKNDSLFVSFFYNNENVQAGYAIQRTEEGFLGTSIYDWDNDNEKDDSLTMKTKKLN